MSFADPPDHPTISKRGLTTEEIIKRYPAGAAKALDTLARRVKFLKTELANAQAANRPLGDQCVKLTGMIRELLAAYNEAADDAGPKRAFDARAAEIAEFVK